MQSVLNHYFLLLFHNLRITIVESEEMVIRWAAAKPGLAYLIKLSSIAIQTDVKTFLKYIVLIYLKLLSICKNLLIVLSVVRNWYVSITHVTNLISLVLVCMITIDAFSTVFLTMQIPLRPVMTVENVMHVPIIVLFVHIIIILFNDSWNLILIIKLMNSLI